MILKFKQTVCFLSGTRGQSDAEYGQFGSRTVFHLTAVCFVTSQTKSPEASKTCSVAYTYLPKRCKGQSAQLAISLEIPTRICNYSQLHLQLITTTCVQPTESSKQHTVVIVITDLPGGNNTFNQRATASACLLPLLARSDDA